MSGSSRAPERTPALTNNCAIRSFVGDIRAQGPTDPRSCCTGQVLPDRARCDAQFPPDRPRACPGTEVQRQQLPYPSHRKSLRRHPASPSIAMAALEARSLLTRETIRSPARPAQPGWAASSEWWAASDQNPGRHQIGIGGRLTSEPAPAQALFIPDQYKYENVVAYSGIL